MKTTVNLKDYLLKHFQHSSFQMGQKEIINDILNKHDVLGILPTGSGKSLCYQLPAKLLQGTTVVVSPLISLMIDQVKQLQATGFKSVVALNSFMSFQERKSIYRNLSYYKLIYVSPELLQQEFLLKELRQVNIDLFVIDEAHCISQWGHEFRPDYLRITNVIEQLNNPPVLALTATATYEVQKDILTALKRPKMIKHIYPIDRPNVALTVNKVTNNHEKIQRLIDVISTHRVPTIVYFSSRQATEKISQLIEEKINDIRVSHYHGGMEQIDRIAIQQQFMNDQLDVICCTSAFGMGINKPNVRLVIHYHFPSELESYIQEMGRAGRDGLTSVGLILFSKADKQLHEHIIEHEFPNNSAIEAVFAALVPLDQQNIVRVSQKMLQIVENNEVHWRFLQYQLEKHGIIRQGQILYDEQQFNIAFTNISNHIQKRYKQKLHKLDEIFKWINETTCLRKSLYNQFQSSVEHPIHCCHVCGFTMSDWQPQYSKSQQILNENFNWDEKLKQLFYIGAYDETR